MSPCLVLDIALLMLTSATTVALSKQPLLMLTSATALALSWRAAAHADVSDANGA